MRKKIKKYWLTASNLTKLGDSLLVVGLGLVGTGTATDNDILNYVSIGMVGIGRFLTTFFKSDKV